jgi:hypothetical protein
MDRWYAAIMAAAIVAGLGVAYAAAPGRTDLLLAAATGALFGGGSGAAGYEIVRRAARAAPAKGLQAFLAVMAGKVLIFPAFLLIIAFSTQLNLAALAAGLAGSTIVGEVLIVGGLLRTGAGGRLPGYPGGRGPDRADGAGRGETKG